MTPAALPRLALVGRPNVGKSTLFNRLVGSRRAIVHDAPGMTRDRVAAACEWLGKRFEVLDTAGLDLEGGAGLAAAIARGSLRAAAEADVVVLVVDARTGLLPLDREVARSLRRRGVARLLLAVNKVDLVAHLPLAADFASLGMPDAFPVSAETGLGLPELLDEVVSRLPAAREGPAPVPVPVTSIALIGRPNVGKSTLFNALVGDERSLVSEIPGTTRDSVDVVVERKGTCLRFVDTAGIRRPGRTARGAEVLSVVMARRAIEAADVTILVVDATAPLAHQDAVVAGHAEARGRALVIAASKWDAVARPRERRRELRLDLERRLRFLGYADVIPVSGHTGHGLDALMRAAARAARAWARKVTTGELNRIVSERLSDLTLAAPGAEPGRILYATQTGARPPAFVFFTSRRVAPHFSEERRIANVLRRELDLAGTPLRLVFRPRRPRAPAARGHAGHGRSR